jgi:hypothetical protein
LHGSRRGPREPLVYRIDQTEPVLRIPTDGDLWVSRWGEYAVIIDRSRDVVRFGLAEVLESVFDDEPIVDYDPEDDHLAVEARCVRFVFKGRRMRLPLKSFLDWWTRSASSTDGGAVEPI